MLLVPESYDVSLHPELEDQEEQPNEIYCQVNVINIDTIDTVAMVVGLTVEYEFKWKDHKISYKNLKNSEKEHGRLHILSSIEKNNIWNPLPELVHDNAIIGETEVS